MSFHGLIAFFFLRRSDIPLFGRNSLFIDSPARGHLGCFQVLVIMSKVVTDIHMQVFMRICFQLLWVNTQECDADQFVSSKVAAPFCISTHSECEFLLLCINNTWC